MVNPDVQDTIITYLIDNHEHIKEACKDIVDTKNTLIKTIDKTLHADMIKDYKKVVREQLAILIGKAYGINTEDTYVVLDGVDLVRFLE